jgi:hypothetical protein
MMTWDDGRGKLPCRPPQNAIDATTAKNATLISAQIFWKNQESCLAGRIAVAIWLVYLEPLN